MKKSFKLDGMHCANCASKIEDAVQKIPGVTNATVSFATTRLTVEGADEQMESILEAVAAAVKKVDPDITMQKA